MTAVLLTGHGGFDRLEYRTDVTVPEPHLGEVLIEVTAAGINNTDINTRIGWYSKTITSETSSGGARIFERYWSTAEATDDGLGIGLAVVAQVAEAHGGIYVESPVADGTGTRFTLHLGRRPPPA